MKLLSKIKNNLGKSPVRFVGRQIYKLLVILPYTIIFLLINKLSFLKKKTPSVPPSTIYFIITSLIYCREKKLTYAASRSVFSPEERYQQTVRTIESIRAQVPQAKIMLVEAGLKDDPFGVKNLVDKFCYIGDSWLVRLACDSRFKSLGEVVMLLYARTFLPAAERYFKMSGRYYLNDDFNLVSWQSGEIMFHYIRPDFISTRLYAFSHQARLVWETALWRSLPYLLLDYPVEYTLARFTPQSLITAVTVVGVSGADATNGVQVKE